MLFHLYSSTNEQSVLCYQYTLGNDCILPSGESWEATTLPKTTSLPSSLLPMVLRIALLDLPGYVLLLSTLPTLATTILRARCTVRLRTGTSGLVLCTIHRLPTTCTSVAAVSVRRTSAFVATVAPYAAPRSRVDSTLQEKNVFRVGTRDLWWSNEALWKTSNLVLSPLALLEVTLKKATTKSLWISVASFTLPKEL